MGFLSDLFDIGPSRSSSGPAAATPQQLALQKQAVQIGEKQVGNVNLTSELFERLMGNLVRGQDRNLQSNRQLFGPPRDVASGRRNDFIAQQKQDLTAFKQSLRADTSVIER